MLTPLDPAALAAAQHPITSNILQAAPSPAISGTRRAHLLSRREDWRLFGLYTVLAPALHLTCAHAYAGQKHLQSNTCCNTRCAIAPRPYH
jgi:hypothetical protein